MIKIKSKILLSFVVIFLLFASSISLATSDVILSTSDVLENSEPENVNIRYSDLYISDEKQYNIENTIEGNVFASVDILNINSKNNSVITGNVYAASKNVNIKSDVTYSETEKDEFGNSKIETINSPSIIYGNVFITANKFVLEPGCEINGDLYICANEVDLQQNAKILGNVFIVSNYFNLDSRIYGDLYATVKEFNMKYYGFIYRDLHLNSKNVNINGYVYRNSFIDCDNIITDNNFINEKDFNIENASSVTFSGEVKGNANINSKSIQFKDKMVDNKITTCKILGDLNYSSNEEINIPNGIVNGNTSYSKYTNSSINILANIWAIVLPILTTLVYVCFIYFIIIKKFMPKYLEKLNNISISNILISLAIGLGILILVPMVVILLFITNIGSLLGLLLLIIYFLLLITAKPLFIIMLATLIKNKMLENINMFILVLIVTIALALISLIPYLGFIVSLLVLLIGLGLVIKLNK